MTEIFLYPSGKWAHFPIFVMVMMVTIIH